MNIGNKEYPRESKEFLHTKDSFPTTDQHTPSATHYTKFNFLTTLEEESTRGRIWEKNEGMSKEIKDGSQQIEGRRKQLMSNLLSKNNLPRIRKLSTNQRDRTFDLLLRDGGRNLNCVVENSRNDHNWRKDGYNIYKTTDSESVINRTSAENKLKCKILQAQNKLQTDRIVKKSQENNAFRDISFINNPLNLTHREEPLTLADAEFIILQHLRANGGEQLLKEKETLQPITLGTNIIHPANLLQRELIGIYRNSKIKQAKSSTSTLYIYIYILLDEEKIPTFKLGQPAGRKQVILLNDWVEEMLLIVNAQEYLHEIEHYEKMKIIYKFAMLELNRQVIHPLYLYIYIYIYIFIYLFIDFS